MGKPQIWDKTAIDIVIRYFDKRSCIKIAEMVNNYTRKRTKATHYMPTNEGGVVRIAFLNGLVDEEFVDRFKGRRLKNQSVASRHKYRARKAGNGGSFTAKEWKALCRKYDNKCLCCGKKKKLHADHVIPVSWEGGTSNIDNIQPLCRSCNSSKGNRSAVDYRQTETHAVLFA